MRQDVRLYINDKRVDFAEPFHILMTYTMEDVTNPPALKNNYTKTVKVQGTNSNNQIFADLWNVQQVAGTKAYDFDLTKRNKFELYLNGEMMESGYCKLDKIVKKGEKLVEYHITLYGGLGDFFYNLSSNEDGTRKTLSDLDFGNEFKFFLTKNVVDEAWSRLAMNMPYSKTNRYDILNFAPCHNGIPQDFDTKKMMVQVKGNPFAFKAQTSGPSNINGYFMVETQGERDYDEWQAGDLRAYMQRPVLRVRSLIEAICDPKNNGGYKVNLDPTFFQRNNPYWEKSWITLPLLPEVDAGKTDEEKVITIPSTVISTSLKYIPLDINTTTVDMNEGSIEVNYTMGFTKYLDPRYNFIYTSYPYASSQYGYENENPTKYYNGAFCFQLVARDSNGMNVFGSDIQVLSSYPKTFYANNLGYRPALSASYDYHTGRFVRTQGTNRFTWNEKLKLKIDKMLLKPDMKFYLTVQKVYYTNDSGYSFPYNTLYRPHSGIEVNPQRSMVITADVNAEQMEECKFTQKTLSKLLFTKERMLKTEHTPLDYLLGFTKQLGLYFLKDPVKKEVSIMTRNTFYSNQSTINLTDHIDRSKDINITPLAFDRKWYEFGLNTEKSEYAEKYRKSFDTEWGVQRVDTNYDYDRSTKKLLDKNCYKNAVMVRSYNRYNQNLVGGDNIPVPPLTIDGLFIKYWNSSNELVDAEYSLNPQKNYNTPLYNEKYYDRVPLMCFEDKDRKPIDGSNVLCFFNGMVSTKDSQSKETSLSISDDIDYMENLNDGKPCWLLSPINTVKAPVIPLFSRYSLINNRVMDSWNMSTPQETYTFDYYFGESNSVFAKGWKEFIKDQYSKNTRVLECWVRLERRVMQDYLRKLFFFDGCYWALLEVVDYDLCGYDCTKCKFIKIQDPKAYSNGQKY